MNFVIFDIEATCWEGMPADRIQETIEIGALRLNEFGEVEGVFNRFIRPTIYPVLSDFCRKLTTIDQISINRAATFVVVIQDFLEWTGFYDDENILFCSWGNFDKKQLQQDCRLHQIDDSWIEENHINLRRQYHDLRGWSSYKSLKKAVEIEGFEFTGTYHRGLSDAENLAKIFVKFIDEWQY